jgi:hypothetical protein
MERLMEKTTLSLPARWLRIVAVALATTLAACVVYEPVPSPQGPSPFERSWNAINGAMADQGVTITEQNFSTGTVRGTRGAVGVLSTVGVQPDGRVRVEINATGSAAVDPTLVDRIRSSYDRRMGR